MLPHPRDYIKSKKTTDDFVRSRHTRPRSLFYIWWTLLWGINYNYVVNEEEESDSG